jgi:adenosylcobinamide-phosphate synthase
LFAFRMLLREVMAVEAALERGLNEGRARLAFIVSRDVSKLSAAEVRESALESVSENLSDSLVAPLFWFAVAGLPGAALYRFANTADAMWGYRGEWEWAGKWAARSDDVLNFIPARLTAIGLLLLGTRAAKSKTSLPREAAKTPSPNSGWPMAALALALGIRLGKPSVYVLNPEGKVPGANEVRAGLRRATITGWVFGLLFSFVVAWFWEVRRG